MKIKTIFVHWSLSLAVLLGITAWAPPPEQMTASANAASYSWHTFFGSSTWDYGYAMAVDGSGNVYITGESGASWNGPSGQVPLHPYTSGDDIFVLKLNSSGAYQWHTFYGGDDESGEGIDVDANGNVYISGNSNVSWNGPSGQAPLNPFSGDADIVVIKLNSNGAYQWHTYMGNPTSDDSFDLAVGGGGVYVTGFSSLGWNGPGANAPLHGLTGYGDMVLVKLNPAGAYQWHTFYGGDAGHANGYGVDVDSGGNVIVTGETTVGWSLPSAALDPYAGGSDIFALKLSSSGAYVWHTFYGGASDDSANDVVVDANDNVYIAGSGASWNNPASPVHDYSGGSQDMTLVKLNPAGAYQWHTFYGSPYFDSGEGVDVDSSGNVYLTGYIDTAVSLHENIIYPYFGNADIAIAWMNAQGVVQGEASYPSSAFDIAVDGTGNIFVTGDSSHGWDMSGTPPLHAHSGSDEIVVIKTQLAALPYVSSITRASANPTSASNVNFTVTFSEPVTGVGLGDFTLTKSGASGAAASGISGTGSVYTVTVNTGSGNGTLRLDLTDDNSIMDADLNPLGGATAGDGNFTGGETFTVIKSATFADVPLGYWAIGDIERLYNSGITGGCAANPLSYCPLNSVTRTQMAVFLLRGIHGSAYIPPAATGTKFNDVSVNTFGAAWIEQLANEGITSGCGGGNFCPNSFVTRAQMAIFLVRAKHGTAFVPPAAAGIFPDVPAGSFGADYIEQLAADGVTSGCGGGNFCPGTVVKRDSMAVFLVRNFNLP